MCLPATHAFLILHPSFVPYLNKGVSIQLITDIFTKTQTREWKKEMEPIWPVHSPWVEITKEDNIRWEPDKGEIGYNTLFKVNFTLETMMKDEESMGCW